MTTPADRRRIFHELHQSGCFVIPNPWDVGSARALALLGFKALATTSSGFAWSSGRADTQMTVSETIAHIGMISDAVEIPVNADFEGGYAVAPEGVATNVSAATATAIAGIVVFFELWAIAFIRSRYMDTPFLQAVFQIVLGGAIVLAVGILIGAA